MAKPSYSTVIPATGKGTGWRPELPDPRDIPLTKKLAPRRSLPDVVALQDEHLPEVRDQGQLGSCVGHAVSGALMYKLSQLGRQAPLSALHSYYESRKLQGWEREDTGAFLRDGAKAAGKVGVSSAWAWPYDPAKFARKPPALAYKSAGWHQAVNYYACPTVDDILLALANDMPVIGGFTCFSSLNADSVSNTGFVPMPGPNDRVEGGHAIWLTKGEQGSRVFQFQNSWGTSWGDKGYGYLPFAYIENGLADDAWAISHEN